MLKYTEHNKSRQRDLHRAHSANTQAKKAAAAKRKAETLLQQQQQQPQQQQPGSSNPTSPSASAQPADGKSPKMARLEVNS
jgi:hypothetical protein